MVHDLVHNRLVKIFVRDRKCLANLVTQVLTVRLWRDVEAYLFGITALNLPSHGILAGDEEWLDALELRCYSQELPRDILWFRREHAKGRQQILD